MRASRRTWRVTRVGRRAGVSSGAPVASANRAKGKRASWLSLYPRAVSAIAVRRKGGGPEILLVHGGASPDATWGALTPLQARWTLASVHRRGYPPSPPPLDGHQD